MVTDHWILDRLGQIEGVILFIFVSGNLSKRLFKKWLSIRDSAIFLYVGRNLEAEMSHYL